MYIFQSGGDLENDENSADVVMDVVKIALSVADKSFKRLCSAFFIYIIKKYSYEYIFFSVVWHDVSYVITISNYKIYVIKRPTQEYNDLNPIA